MGHSLKTSITFTLWTTLFFIKIKMFSTNWMADDRVSAKNILSFALDMFFYIVKFLMRIPEMAFMFHKGKQA